MINEVVVALFHYIIVIAIASVFNILSVGALKPVVICTYLVDAPEVTEIPGHPGTDPGRAYVAGGCRNVAGRV